MGDWVNGKLESREFASAEEFIRTQLYRDWLEEKIEEAIQEPATPVTSDDWEAARGRLEGKISGGE